MARICLGGVNAGGDAGDGSSHRRGATCGSRVAGRPSEPPMNSSVERSADPGVVLEIDAFGLRGGQRNAHWRWSPDETGDREARNEHGPCLAHGQKIGTIRLACGPTELFAAGVRRDDHRATHRPWRALWGGRRRLDRADGAGRDRARDNSARRVRPVRRSVMDWAMPNRRFPGCSSRQQTADEREHRDPLHGSMTRQRLLGSDGVQRGPRPASDDESRRADTALTHAVAELPLSMPRSRG